MLPSYKLSLWFYRKLPGFLLKPLLSVYSVYYSWFFQRNLRRQQQILQRLFPGRPARVAGGPFQGMNYVDRSNFGNVLPKLVGSYEAEINDVVEQIAAHGYDRALNVGCAEGYYATGLAMRSPKTTVFAFDIDPQAARLCGEMAQLNRVGDRVLFSGACDPAKLNEMIQGETIVVCDCEGYELELLDPARAPKLAQADMIVELHRAPDPQISIEAVLEERFRGTHHYQFIPIHHADPAHYPVLQTLSPADQKTAVDELRTGVAGWGWWRQKSPGPRQS